MDSFLANVGMLAIACLIVYIYKKVLEWYDYNHSGFYEDERVYRAADAFVYGASPDDVKAIVRDCYELDEADMEKILSAANLHRVDKDGGYRAFIRLVNKLIGEDVYNEKRHIKHKIGLPRN